MRIDTKFQIPSSKIQINSKSQIPIIKSALAWGWYWLDLSIYFDFCRIDENIFFSSFASCIKRQASSAFFRLLVSLINLSQ